MSARLARSAFASIRAPLRSRTNLAFSRRNLSAQSHGTQPKKSDLPWIVGSAVLFGPLLLYLLSPSARKSTHDHAVHNDHHDFPTLKREKEEKAGKESTGREIIKDDEGKPADVAASIDLARESDVPKDSQSPEAVASTRATAEGAPEGDKDDGAAQTDDAAAKSPKTERPKAQAPAANTSADENRPSEVPAEEAYAPKKETA